LLSRQCGESDFRFDPAPAEIRIPKLGKLWVRITAVRDLSTPKVDTEPVPILPLSPGCRVTTAS
jgi:hypothetical protein